MDTARALAELAADPDAVDSLPEGELADVLAELERVRARLWMRLNRPSPNGDNRNNCSDEPEPDRLLKAVDVADVLDVTERYVYDHADGWPFTRRISRQKLRFSERGLYRWMESRP